MGEGRGGGEEQHSRGTRPLAPIPAFPHPGGNLQGEAFAKTAFFLPPPRRGRVRAGVGRASNHAEFSPSPSSLPASGRGMVPVARGGAHAVDGKGRLNFLVPCRSACSHWGGERPPPAFHNRRSRGLPPQAPLRPYPPPSCAACPDRAPPHSAWLRAAPAGRPRRAGGTRGRAAKALAQKVP